NIIGCKNSNISPNDQILLLFLQFFRGLFLITAPQTSLYHPFSGGFGGISLPDEIASFRKRNLFI
ncbi:MAG: hypothetical protein ACOCPC_09720, partial [Segatella copri]